MIVLCNISENLLENTPKASFMAQIVVTFARQAINAISRVFREEINNLENVQEFVTNKRIILKNISYGTNTFPFHHHFHNYRSRPSTAKVNPVINAVSVVTDQLPLGMNILEFLLFLLKMRIFCPVIDYYQFNFVVEL